jgi:hypothetical protein
MAERSGSRVVARLTSSAHATLKSSPGASVKEKGSVPTDCLDEQFEPIPDCPNGLGNLIVGYNESRDVDIRTGSHNGSDIHVMLALRRSSRQVVVADKQLDRG